MKKVPCVAIAILFFISCSDEIQVSDINSFQNLNAKSTDIELEFTDNPCNVKFQHTLDFNYEPGVYDPNYYGGPITGTGNYPNCQNGSSTIDLPDQGIVDMSFYMDYDLGNKECYYPDVFLHITDHPPGLPVLGYGNIDKKYPLVLGVNHYKLNLDFILRCDGAVEPSGPNLPECSPNPYTVPFDYQFTQFSYPNASGDWCNYIFGGKGFYYRIEGALVNQCNKEKCSLLSKWEKFSL